jgi:hypothetical protein
MNFEALAGDFGLRGAARIDLRQHLTGAHRVAGLDVERDHAAGDLRRERRLPHGLDHAFCGGEALQRAIFRGRAGEFGLGGPGERRCDGEGERDRQRCVQRPMRHDAHPRRPLQVSIANGRYAGHQPASPVTSGTKPTTAHQRLAPSSTKNRLRIASPATIRTARSMRPTFFVMMQSFLHEPCPSA